MLDIDYYMASGFNTARCGGSDHREIDVDLRPPVRDVGLRPIGGPPSVGDAGVHELSPNEARVAVRGQLLDSVRQLSC